MKNSNSTKIRKIRGRAGTFYLLSVAVGALLVNPGGLPASRAAEATYKLFGREVGGYSSKADLPALVTSQIGPRAAIADWDDIKKLCGASEAELKAFCEKIGLAPNSSAWVTLGGKRYWQEQRQYFIYRADHKPPADFLAHDQLQNNFLMLGSWYGTRSVVVKVTGYNSADAAKWAKWDQMFKEANSKDISGRYALVSVNGKPMPASVSHEGAMLQVRTGTFNINADGTCSSRITFLPPSGAETTLETKAVYTREGPTLTMQWEGAGGTTGTIKGDTFTMENEGMIFAYKKIAQSKT